MKKINLSNLTEITRGRIDRIKVFSDFLALVAIRISNSVDPVHFDERHKQAATIFKTYTDTEHKELHSYMEELFRQIALNGKAGICEDILGKLFQEFGFHRKEQDQTPPNMARLVGQIILKDVQTIP